MLLQTGFDEMRGANLFDKRRNIGVARLFEKLLIMGSDSFSAAVGHDGRQAANRVFGAPEIVPSAMMGGHVLATVDRVRRVCPADEWLLILQDTSSFNYSTLKKTTGLGPIGVGNSTASGLLSHGALAVSSEGVPLGVVDLEIWARSAVEKGRSPQQKSKDNRNKPTAEKESKKWLECIERVQTHFPSDQKLLFIQDREADMFDLFCAPRRAGAELLVRAAQARIVEIVSDDPDAHNGVATLFDAVRSSEALGQITVQVNTNPDRTEREVVLDIRARPVLLKAPSYRRADQDCTSQAVWLVSAREAEPPEGIAALDWTLITTIPVRTFEEACRIVTFYSKRWLIERLHYTLKSGLGAEDLRIDDAHSLKNALSLYYMVAWRILHLTYLARKDPQQPAENSLEDIEIEVLSQIEGKPIHTISTAIIAIAKLGGYRHYRNAASPGIKGLWRGIRELNARISGYKLAMLRVINASH